MIQKLGGARFIDHGPSAAIHARGRVPMGVMVSQAITPNIGQQPRTAAYLKRERERALR